MSFIFFITRKNINSLCSRGSYEVQISDQLDATISPLFYLTFIYSLTCFGRPHAHHQELNNGRPARPRPTALLSPHSKGKTRGCYCSCWVPDDGREDAQNMLSCKQTSSKILEILLHLVGHLFELYDDAQTYKL